MNRFSKLTLLGLAALLALGACSKGEQSSSTTTTTTTDNGASASPASSPGDMAASPAAASSSDASSSGSNGVAANDGSKIYQTNCSSCHQANGQGVPGTFPPLAKNAVVTGDATKVIHIVKYGLNGKIEVNGNAYNGQMPAWGSQLSNADIAAAITYVRSAWGNKAGAVTESQVAGVNK